MDCVLEEGRLFGVWMEGAEQVCAASDFFHALLGEVKKTGLIQLEAADNSQGLREHMLEPK